MKNSLTGGGLAETEDNPQKKNKKIRDRTTQFPCFPIFLFYKGNRASVAYKLEMYLCPYALTMIYMIS